MHGVGDDVWTPAAVRYIKVLACQELWRALEGVLSGREIGDITNGAGEKEEKDIYESREAVEAVEEMNGGGNLVEDPEYHAEDYNEAVEEEEGGGGRGGPNAETVEQDTQVEQSNKTNEEEVRVNGDLHKSMIGMDWAIQLLFDALYLDEALQRKGSNSRNSGISSLAGKIEATIGIRVSLFCLRNAIRSLTSW